MTEEEKRFRRQEVIEHRAAGKLLFHPKDNKIKLCAICGGEYKNIVIHFTKTHNYEIKKRITITPTEAEIVNKGVKEYFEKYFPKEKHIPQIKAGKKGQILKRLLNT